MAKNRARSVAVSLALALPAGLAGCRTTSQVPAPHHAIERYLEFAPGDDDWVRTELFFGFERDGKPVVSESDWEDFLRTEVTPRFRGGFTVIPARGQWENGHGTIDVEQSRILVIYTAPRPEANDKIEAIRAAFLQRFGVESVLRVTSPAKVSF